MASLRAWAKTDVGKKRKQNEDALLVDESLGLYVVCDGMGGHAAGEVASATAAATIQKVVAGEKSVIARFAAQDTPENRDALVMLMERAIETACAEIFRISSRESDKRGMGTTCVALITAGKKAVLGHVGDSRIYLVRNNRAHQLTEDHTLVQDQLKRGVITAAQAAKSSVRNVITRAVGLQPSVAVDTLITDLMPGDAYVLCSDGLHGYLEDGELPVLAGVAPREMLCDQLVEMANERGGKDNVTVVVVAVEGEDGEESTNVEAKMELLHGVPLFEHMTYKELLSIIGAARAHRFEVGTQIIREGEQGDALFILFGGRAEVLRGGSVIATLEAGAHFGEMGLLDQVPRSATVRVVDPVSAIAIDRETLLKLLRKDSVLSVKLLWSLAQVLSERLRATSGALASVKGDLDKLGSTTAKAAFDVIGEERIAPPPPPKGGE